MRPVSGDRRRERERVEVRLSWPPSLLCLCSFIPQAKQSPVTCRCVVGTGASSRSWNRERNVNRNVNRKGERPFVLATPPWWFRLSPVTAKRVIIAVKTMITVNIN